MGNEPLWYRNIQFSSVGQVGRLSPAGIPDLPGCYVFTPQRGSLNPERVLYVGKALNLRQRLRGYLVDYMKTRPTTHKGRAFLFYFREHYGDGNLFVRWTIYGDPNTLEASLIDHLNPWYNGRYESGGFADDEDLDPAMRP